MLSGNPRTPSECPEGFLGRYTVVPGDTFYNIARMFRVGIWQLASNNPHIIDPNILYPGDILCVPGFIYFPCCIILRSLGRVPFGTAGVCFINFAPRGGQAVNFLATLPLPEYFGDFDMYIGEIFIPGIGGFGNRLFASLEDPPNWTTRIDLPTVAYILPNSRIVIRPVNSMTSLSGPIVLQGITIENRIC